MMYLFTYEEWIEAENEEEAGEIFAEKINKDVSQIDCIEELEVDE